MKNRKFFSISIILFGMIIVGCSQNAAIGAVPVIKEETPEVTIVPTKEPTLTPTPVDVSQLPAIKFELEDVGVGNPKFVPYPAPSYISEEVGPIFVNYYYSVVMYHYCDKGIETCERSVLAYNHPLLSSFTVISNGEKMGIFKDINPTLAPQLDKYILFGNQDEYKYPDGTLQWTLILFREDVPTEGQLSLEEELEYDAGNYCIFSPHGVTTLKRGDKNFSLYEVEDLPQNLLTPEVFQLLLEGETFIDLTTTPVTGRCNFSLIQERMIVN